MAITYGTTLYHQWTVWSAIYAGDSVFRVAMIMARFCLDFSVIFVEFLANSAAGPSSLTWVNSKCFPSSEKKSCQWHPCLAHRSLSLYVSKTCVFPAPLEDFRPPTFEVWVRRGDRKVSRFREQDAQIAVHASSKAGRSQFSKSRLQERDDHKGYYLSRDILS
jgi:hypothetical protein